jgi:group II intron reverse transcriptase/maturase
MGNRKDTQRSEIVCTKQQRIAEIARQHPKEKLTALNHYLDIAWLEEAYQRVRKTSAPGIDGQTVADYGQPLETNLKDLLSRAKSGSYVAPPVKRVHIPKGEGAKETRPIGIPTTEDKVLQRAVVMLLEPIYEGEFYHFSYGFRPGRSAHQALEAFWQQATRLGIQWVLEVDIRKYFDSVNRSKLEELVGQRTGDGMVLRLVSKWLHAGVMEEERLHYPEAGTPQGGVVSPLLSNIYLHEVFDRWFAEVVQERMAGKIFAVRFADDMVIGFTHRRDAEKVHQVIFKRFEKYGLSLHPEKTQLIPFGRPGQRGPEGQDSPVAGTFDFLGFTHYWGKSRTGKWIIKRKTAAKRQRRTLKAINEWCRRHRHEGPREQFQTLVRKLEGHYAYYGITGNGRCLTQVFEGTKKLWHKWLNRRSNAPAGMTWERFRQVVREQFVFPFPRVIHSIYRAKP